MWEGCSFVDPLCFAECIQQICTVYQRHSDITHGKIQCCQLEELLRKSINSLFLLRFLRRFATGLSKDYEAVKAGVTLLWSSGPVEGHINRLKMLTRQMFGRARLDLLSRRFVLAPRDEPGQPPQPRNHAQLTRRGKL